ncbi:hypothetical protein F4810DRAFT_649184 [Camillea tinctor]|nr:hypothetical protein F4810DRAFT_649184 [Camillea tinctor]
MNFMASRDSITMKEPNPQRLSRFTEDLDSETVSPPTNFLDHENLSNHILVNSKTSSPTGGAARPTEKPSHKPSLPRRSRRLEQKQEQEQELLKQCQHRPPPLQIPSQGKASRHRQHATSPPVSATTAAFRTLPSPSTPPPKPAPAATNTPQNPKSPYLRLRDSQGRPTAYALDQHIGRFPMTDPRSVNNEFFYEWVKRSRKPARTDRWAEWQRRGFEEFKDITDVEAELVPAHTVNDNQESSKNKKKKRRVFKPKEENMWVRVMEMPAGGWKEINWGGTSSSHSNSDSHSTHVVASAALAEANPITSECLNRSPSLKRKREDTSVSPPSSPASSSHVSPSCSSISSRKILSQKLRDFLSRHHHHKTTATKDEEEQEQEQDSSYQTLEPTTTATTIQRPSRRPCVVSPEELEMDAEAQEEGPDGQRKYGPGDYAAIVALAGGQGAKPDKK